ncbi:MAG: tetratricopeptide repeat protein, partial [Anaerolineae bacterium]|nr:tetratricopeptide repeat protein [Anaerolineae bacterium]
MPESRVPIASKIREAQTPAERLRQTLTRLEGRLPQIGRGDPAQAVATLNLLDQADSLIDAIAEQGADLGPERSRFQTVTQQFDRKLGPFLQQLGGAEALAALRATENPPESRPWWFADRRLRERQRTRRRRALITIGATVGVLAILGVLYAIFLAPDEATRERFRSEQDAEQALMEGDLPEALTQAERALSYAPGNPDLLVLKGVVLELLGSTDLAESAFEEARESYADVEAFYVNRAQNYMIAGRTELAVADTSHLIEINPDSAIAYYQRGNANAALGNLAGAIADMEKASELAEAAGQIELQGMARVQLGNLMMMMSAPL